MQNREFKLIFKMYKNPKISYLIAILNEAQLPIFAAEKIKENHGLKPHKWCFILNFGDLKIIE